MAIDLPGREDVAEALKWFQFVSTSVEADQRRREEEDLGFQTPEGAWPQEVRDARGATKLTTAGGTIDIPPRPMLSVATLDEPIMLVSNQMRAAHLGITIHPLSEDASDETAQVLQGIYRTIEVGSRADIARNWAYDHTLWCGRGVYKVNKAYDPEGGHPLDQKLIIERVLYQGNVFLDPYAQQPDYSDGRRAMEVADIPFARYKRDWPNSTLSGLSDGELVALGAEQPQWISGSAEGSDPQGRAIRVAREWRVDIDTIPQVLLADNTVVDAEHAKNNKLPLSEDPRPVPDREERHVYTRIINCAEVLDPWQEWDGQYIPLVPTVGRELQPVKGKRIWYGMVAPAKDGVRLTNYAASGAAEMAALEPKAPWQGVEGVFEGHELEYQKSNITNVPFIQHKPTDLLGRPAPPPARVQVDVSRMGPSMQLLQMGRDFVRQATFTYGPALGEQTPAHRSGRAIVALQDQTTQGTSHYLDNFANISLKREAQIVLDLIPFVYSRPGHVARILDEEGKASTVMLNTPFVPGQNGGPPQALPYDTPEEQQAANAMVANPNHPAKHYDLNKGRYGVSVTIGKSKVSRLQEGNDALSLILQSDPQLMPLIGPEWMRYQDFPGARAIEKILRKQRDHTMPWLADDPNAAQMDPQRLLAENNALKQQLQQAGLIIQTKQIEQQGKFQTAAMQETEESKRAHEKNATQIAVARISAAKASLDSAREAMEEAIALGQTQQFEAQQAALARAHEAAMAAGAHAASLQQGAQDNAHAALMGQGDHDAAMAQGEQANQAAMAQQAQAQAAQAQNGGGA